MHRSHGRDQCVLCVLCLCISFISAFPQSRVLAPAIWNSHTVIAVCQHVGVCLAIPCCWVVSFLKKYFKSTDMHAFIQKPFLPWGSGLSSRISRSECLNSFILLCMAPEHSTGSNLNCHLQHGQHSTVASFLFLFI